MKKFVSMLLLVVMLTALVGCGSGSDQAAAPSEEEAVLTTADLKIGVVMKSFDEFQSALIKGAVDQAISMGVKEENIITLAPKNESDVVGQVQIIENCISQGVNLLVLSAQTPDIVNAP